MKEEILSNLDNAPQLERLYRADKSAFKQAFKSLYPDLKDNTLVSFWNARLNFVKEGTSPGTGKDLVFVVVASLMAGLIAKLPAFFHLDEELFYTRNVGFIIFPLLAAYFALRNKLSTGKTGLVAGVTLVSLVFINSLPGVNKSDTFILSCIHLNLFLWSVLGFAFVGGIKNNDAKRIGYLRYNGDLVVITTLIVIAGAILTGITIGLFSLIGLDIEKFYFENIVAFGLPAAPILGTYLTQRSPQLVSKISPVIAKIFSPLVMVMLGVYLVAIIYSGKDPYNNRDFLLVFNALLVGVMALIVFSVAEMSKTGKSQTESWVLFLLSVLTVIVNGIALSAILFRISEWGITPNRAAVLGGNILILINLLLVSLQLFRVLSMKADKTGVAKIIAFYLPVYCLWAIIVTFIFPLMFGFK